MPVMVRNYVAVLSKSRPDAMRHNGKAVAIFVRPYNDPDIYRGDISQWVRV